MELEHNEDIIDRREIYHEDTEVYPINYMAPPLDPCLTSTKLELTALDHAPQNLCCLLFGTALPCIDHGLIQSLIIVNCENKLR